MEDYVAGRTRMAEQKIAQAEAQAIQEVRSLSADVAIAAAEKILAAKVKGEAADALIQKSIGDVRAKLN
ncbi:MAG: F0F1 ATP synthase subunit B, partial [Bauldia sp.]